MDHHRLRKYRGPETWARVRAAYVAGEPAPSVALRFDVGLANLRRRAMKEGWTRKRIAETLDLKPIRGERDGSGALAAVGAGAVEPTPFINFREAMARATRRAAWLIAHGRSGEATALLKAVDELSRVGRYALPEARV